MSSTFGIKKLSDLKSLKRTEPMPEFTIVELTPNEIVCLDQVRGEKNIGFSDESLQELSNSMKAEGQHEPVIVRNNPDKAGPKYIMVAGERRLRAAEMARIKIKAIVREVSEDEARRIQLSENIHRENLSQLEVAQAVKDDLERLGNHANVAKAWNKSQQWVSQQLKFLEIAQSSGPAADAIKENLTSDRTAITTLGKLQDVNFEKAIDVIEQLKADQKEGKKPNVRKAAEQALKEEKLLQTHDTSNAQGGQEIQEDIPNTNNEKKRHCKTIKQFIQEIGKSHKIMGLHLYCLAEILDKLVCYVCNTQWDDDVNEIVFEPKTFFSVHEAMSYLLLHMPQSKCHENFHSRLEISCPSDTED